ncbi:MAG: hypothetical protein ABIK89_00510 [Planctomycetota bacterium]
MNRQMDLPNASAWSPRIVCGVALTGGLLVVAAVAGCRGFSLAGPSEPGLSSLNRVGRADAPTSVSASPAYQTSDPPLDGRAILARDDSWIRATQPQEEVAAGPGYRWRYPHLEELLAGPDKRLPRLHAALDDRDPIVATNAAIALARRGDASAREQLARAVGRRSPRLPSGRLSRPGRCCWGRWARPAT